MAVKVSRIVLVGVVASLGIAIFLGLGELSKAVAARDADPVLKSYELIRSADVKYRAKVRDYTADFLRWEVVNGQRPREDEHIFTKLRNQPFSLYMRWDNTDCKGRELIYIADTYNDRVKVHVGGLGDLLLPSLDLLLDDPRLRAKSRHRVDEAGLGKLLKSLRRQWELGIKNGDIRVDHLRPRVIDDRRVSGFERLLPKRDCYQSGRLKLYFDNAGPGFPVQVTAYDWHGRRPDGEWRYRQVERYTYRNLLLNPGLTDGDFDPRSYPGFGLSNVLSP